MTTLQEEMLFVSRKLSLLRIHHGIPQVEFAERIQAGTERVINAEKDLDVYTDVQRWAAEKLFGIEGLPLTQNDRAARRERLYRWRDETRDRNMVKAREIHKEMANIENLEPCDFHLVMLSKMFEAYMLMVENDLVAARKSLMMPIVKVKD